MTAIKDCISTLFNGCQDVAEPEATVETLDIRTVDREVLEMADLFYTLIESMLRSI